MVQGITAIELKAWQDAGEDFALIDVREPWEHGYARIADSELRPLGEIDAWAPTLDPGRPTVLYCHSGVRSYHACLLLERRGFHNVKNLSGGIDSWSVEIDPHVPRY